MSWSLEVDRDPAWTLSVRDDGIHRRARETLCTVANGRVGTRGSAEEQPAGSAPGVVAMGVYDDGEPPSLLPLPSWTGVELHLPARPDEVWHLDMRHGVLVREVATDHGPLRSVRFASLARPACMVLGVDDPRAAMTAGTPMRPADEVDEAGVASAVAASGPIGVSAAAWQEVSETDRGRSLRRLAAYVPDGDVDTARRTLEEARRLGPGRLYAEHRQAWSGRWDDAGVTIEGDPDTELAVRFALFHLLSSVPTEGEAAVGARGLSGPAYRGHVFWDADVFVLPALAATVPEAARAMLEYRIRRLDAARRLAARHGGAGARFPWESAHDGTDVTPLRRTDAEGREVPIRTGRHEEHIVADVAWAARHYVRWTGDESLLEGPGRGLVLDTARYWASRIRIDRDGRGHVLGVMGPDEYHEVVDDNAFTNVMARANLRWAADLADRHGGAGPDEVEAWLDLADRLVDGYDADTGVYEQFAGYSRLEPLMIEDIAAPPIAADLLLGSSRVADSQIVKQADVLMLHHLVPEETAPGSLEPNLDHYLPRTAHGSSLSPPIHASLLARAGRLGQAVEWFRMSARLDLDDLTGTTSGGLHLATMGGVWQAMTFGFLGAQIEDGALRLDPRLPPGWTAVEQRLVVRGVRTRVWATADEVTVDCDGRLPVAVGSRPVGTPAERRRFVRHGAAWEEAAWTRV